MDELKEMLKSLQNKMNNHGDSLSEVSQILNKISEVASKSMETDIQKSFIDSILSIPAFDEYDTVFTAFKESIYEDRLNNSKKARSSLVSLEKEAVQNLRTSKVFDPAINKEIMSYFTRINNIQSVNNLTKKNKDRIEITYEYDSLIFDYNHYKEMGVIDGLKESQDIFGATKIVPFEIPSKEMVDEKNELDQKLNEFKRVKDLISQNPEFTSVIKSSYPKTLNKLDEYIEKYETQVKIVNESLAKTDYKEIKEAVENARINAKKETNENDKNKENILDSKKRELEALKLQSNPNYARIEALQNEIAALEKEEQKEEKTHEELKDENISAEKVEFEKSDDETLVENADYINIRAEAIKRLNDDEPGLEGKVLPSIYEAKVSEYMQKVRNERIQNRSIEDIKFELYKQDRTLTDEVTDEEFDKKSDKIDEYENAATMYIEKENEVLDRSLQEENDFKALLNELDNNPDLDLSDYEKMLEELDKQTILTEEEKEELTAEIEARKLA